MRKTIVALALAVLFVVIGVDARVAFMGTGAAPESVVHAIDTTIHQTVAPAVSRVNVTERFSGATMAAVAERCWRRFSA